MSGQCCEVKQRRARLVAGWVTQALEQGRLGSYAHAGYHQFYSIDICQNLVVWTLCLLGHILFNENMVLILNVGRSGESECKLKYLYFQ